MSADLRCAKCEALLFEDGRCPQGHGYFTTMRPTPDFVIHRWARDLEAEPLGSWENEQGDWSAQPSEEGAL